jgi:sec-independent protein translocase protein TatB
MLDVGWQELFVIAVITIIVVGPREIPRVLRTVTMWVRKIKDMARDFQSSIDDIAREADLDDIKKQLAEAKDFDFEQEFENAIDPSGEVTNAIHDLNTLPDQVEHLNDDAAEGVEQEEAPSTEDKPAALPNSSGTTGA